MNTFIHKNITISFSDIGKGNTIVLLHGYLENSTMWNFCIPELIKKNRIIAIDLLGHGQSESLGYIHTVEVQAEIVLAVLQYLKIKKAKFVGHSMGGYIALAFAELYPRYIKSLVLINSTSLPDSDDRKQNRDRAIKMVKKDYETFVRLSIANLFTENSRLKFSQEIENIKIEALKTPLQGIIAALEGMKIRKNRESILKKLDIPVMIIFSKKDPVLEINEQIKQVENTNIKLVVLEEGHMSHIENTSELLYNLLKFIN